jgi:hypothetical protein
VLVLGGPHTYFNGHDKARYLLDALDIETELTFTPAGNEGGFCSIT